MKHQAEITTFAIFLFCSLVHLASLAPTVTSEDGKTTTGQRQKHSTSRIKPFLVLEKQAAALFKNYNVCSSVTHRTTSWLAADSQVKETVKKITECPALDADCCMHMFYNILQTLRSDIELICGKNFIQIVDANIIQLNVTIAEQAALYTCKNKGLSQKDRDQIQGMKMAKKKMYIWLVLQKYEQSMQNATKIYSSVKM